MDSKLFWQGVEAMYQQLVASGERRISKARASGDAADLEGQPANTKSIFLASRAIPGIQGEGAVAEVGYRLAAQRIVEQTHRVATAAEIERFQRLQEDSAAIIRAINAAQSGKRSTVISVEPTTPRARA